MNWIGKLLGFKDVPMTDVKKVLEESRQEAKEMFSDFLEPKKDISEPVSAIVEYEMTKEEFIHHYIWTTNGCMWTDKKDGDDILKSLIGSIYDLQQQISDLQRKLDDQYIQ